MKNESLSIFGGTGFVGTAFRELTSQKTTLVPRDSRTSPSNQVLYLISTTDNYNVLEDVHKDVDVNVSILLDVLKSLKPGSTVNFVSSWFVYGNAPLPAKETSECHPKGFYSITKRTAEQLLISYCETFGLSYRIFRLSNVYGPGDRGVSKKKNALQFLIGELKKNAPIKLYHDGHFYRDYMHVTDVARAIDFLIEKGPLNEIFNIGTGEKQEFRSIIMLAKELLKSSSKIESMEPPEFHKTVQVKDFWMDVSKLKNLGFKGKISLEEGIEELCQSEA